MSMSFDELVDTARLTPRDDSDDTNAANANVKREIRLRRIRREESPDVAHPSI